MVDFYTRSASDLHNFWAKLLHGGPKIFKFSECDVTRFDEKMIKIEILASEFRYAEFTGSKVVCV